MLAACPTLAHTLPADASSVHDDARPLRLDTLSHSLIPSLSHSLNRSLSHSLGLLLGLLLTLLFTAPAHAQSNPGTSPQLYLLPQNPAASAVSVETHIATLRVLDDPAGPLVSVDATYRLRNPADTPIDLPLRLFAGGDRSLSPYQGLTLTLNDQLLPLAPEEGGGYLSQVSLAAEGRLTLRLRYQVGLGSGGLATLRYAPGILNSWAGNISLRVEFILPNNIPAESWVSLTPADWRYSVSNEVDITGVRWLYDFSAPEAPLRLQFVSPPQWRSLQEAQATATGDAAAETFLRLGDLYRDLARVADTAAVRERFHAQAVAVYSAGQRSRGIALASPAARAGLHIGLADLYRRRLVESDRAGQTAYADLLVTEINQALALLPAEDSRRGELQQWLVEALQLRLGQALTLRDWPQALTLVERLAQLPPTVVDPARLAEDRRAILVQQALQLMEQGNREAALAVAGDQLTAADLTPPATAFSLFSGWQITVTARPDALHLSALALTTPDRAPQARASLEDALRVWQEGTRGEDYAFALAETPAGVQLDIAFPAGGNGFLLARLLPLRADYALLRSLLTQIAPTIQRESGLVRQQITLRQPLDLEPVAGEWNMLAAGLEEQANSFDAQGRAISTGSAADAEAALAAAVQAVNYRTTAAEWRRLARQSALNLIFQVDDALTTRLRGEPPTRAWSLTAAAPAQTLVFQTQTLSLSRVLLGGVAALIVLMLLAALLWGLL